MIYQDCGASEFNQTDSNWSHAFSCGVSFNFWSSYLWHLDSHFDYVKSWLFSPGCLNVTGVKLGSTRDPTQWPLGPHQLVPSLVGTSTFRLSKGLESEKKMKNVSLCWQTSLSLIPPFVGNSSQFHFPSHSTIPLNPHPHRPKTQSDFGSKAKQFSHAGGLTIISPCEAMQIHSDKSWKGTWHVWKQKLATCSSI